MQLTKDDWKRQIENIKTFWKGNKGHILIVSFVMTVLFFGLLFIPSYATDTYATFQDNTVWEYMLYDNGRITIGLVYLLFMKCLSHIPNIGIIAYKMSYMMAIVFLTLSLYRLACRVNKHVENAVWSVLIAFLICINPFSIEYFLYLEMGAFFFALYCVVEAFEQTIQYWEKRKKKTWRYILIWLLLAVYTYQVMVGMYVVLCLPFILLYTKKWRTFVWNNILVAFFYGVSLSSAYLVTNFVFHSLRLEEKTGILDSIWPTVGLIREILFDPFYHLPNNYILYALFVTGILSLLYAIQSQKFLWETISIGYLFLGCLVVGFFPFFMGVTGTAGVAPRTIYTFGGSIGIILLYCLLRESNHFGICVVAIRSFIVILICTEYLLFMNVLVDQYQCNQVDQYICQMIGERIHTYEDTTGETVKEICFYRDASEIWGFDGAYQNGLITRAHAVGWSKLASINYYLNTDYVMGEPKQQYIDYFTDKDWNFYSDGQLIFDGDTLHLCIY